MAEPYAFTPHSEKEDMEWTTWTKNGTPRVLNIVPELNDPNKIGREAQVLAQRWADRAAAFERYDSILAMLDLNKAAGLESMVTNDASTMFSLSTFLAGTSRLRRTVAVGNQGPVAERRSGSSERALTSWWDYIDEMRILNGTGTFQGDLAHWLCLYGWYAVRYDVEAQDVFCPVAVPMNPAECFPLYSDGLERFVNLRQMTLGELHREMLKHNVALSGVKDSNRRVKLVDWWWRTPGDEVVRAMVATGLGQGWTWIMEPEKQDGTQIPVVIGKVSGSPSQGMTGSVFEDNARVYKDFNRWLSFLMTLSRRHAQSPTLGKALDVDEKDLTREDITMGGKVILTDNPEASITTVSLGPSVVEVQQFLSIIDGMLQRGGYPYLVYGGLGRELSGFAISQLLQAAERRIGPQMRRLEFIDGTIGNRWLSAFRDGKYGAVTLSGADEGNPRKSFVEEFSAKSVPKRFKVVVEAPLRIGNDLMSRIAMARQALGAVEQVLDHRTVLDEILQMQDPALIMDRIAEDKARQMTAPIRAALALKIEALDILEKGGPGAKEAADLLDTQAAQILAPQPAGGASPSARPAAQEVPPEMAGVSPDVLKAAMQSQVPNVRR